MPLTTLREVTLRDGSALSIKLGLRGLSEIQPALAQLLAPSGFPDLDIVYRILTQSEDDGSIQRHFFGFRDGRLAAFLKYDASRRVPCVCSFGYVFTAENARKLGIAENMCRVAVDDFAKLGGRALFLSGGEPASDVYLRVGFRPFNGHIMRCVIGDEKAFGEFYFAGRPVAGIRKLAWADWAMAAVLYGQPTNIHIRDYGIKLYSGPGQEIIRFQSVVPLLMRPQEAGAGLSKVAEDAAGHLVGIANLRQLEPGRALLDLHVHPTSRACAGTLLKEMLSTARQMGWGGVSAKAARADEEKLKVFQEAGGRIVSEAVENTGGERTEAVVELRF